MAYCYLFSESFEDGSRRIALEQAARLHRALEAGQPGPEQIHDARKALKRMRALLHLVRHGLGEKRFRAENAALRDIARQLSSARETDVLGETIATLQAHFGLEPGGMAGRLRERAARRHRAGMATLQTTSISAVLQALTASQSRLAKLRLKSAGARMIAMGIARSYSPGRQRIKRAYATGRARDFHDLRKSVQRHWRQMQLLSNAWPEAMAARASAAQELSQLLGEDHDLWALLKFMKEERRCLFAEDRLAMTGLCAARQHQLRGAAGPKLRRLFAEAAPDIAQRITGYWRAGRQMSAIDDRRPAKQGQGARVIELKP